MSHFIRLEQAIAMTKTFRENRGKGVVPQANGLNALPLSQTFDRAAIDTLLSQPGCEKIRIYFGMDKGLKVHAIIVGVNEKDEDMLPNISTEISVTETNDDDGGSVVVDEGVTCPPFCPPPSHLNP